jgi:HPt (histidine-containing phosphotransfer) domain-containing protein
MTVTSALTDGLTSTTQAQFAALRQRYVLGLTNRWMQIANPRDVTDLLAALHRLTGSAGSFGFARLSQCARAAEELLVSGRTAGLAQALVQLEKEILLAQSGATQE